MTVEALEALAIDREYVRWLKGVTRRSRARVKTLKRQRTSIKKFDASDLDSAVVVCEALARISILIEEIEGREAPGSDHDHRGP